MNRRTWFALIGISIFNPIVVRAQKFQSYLEFRAVQEGAEAGEGGARKLWRSGTRYARIEEPSDPRINVEPATIINEPDVYIVDLASKRGRHIVDPDPRGEVHVPLFVGKSTMTLLEAGREIQFFKSQKATRLSDVNLQNSKHARFFLQIDDQKLTLFIDLAARVPKRILIEGPKIAYSIWYDQYVRREPFDAALYRPPEGFIPVVDKVQEEISRDIDTPFKERKNEELHFVAYDAVNEAFQSDQLCRGKPTVLYVFSPEGPLGDKSMEYAANMYERHQGGALCFIPVLSSGKAQKHGDYGFPVYELQMFNGIRSGPMDALKRLTGGVVPAAFVVDRANRSTLVKIHGTAEFSGLDARIGKALGSGTTSGKAARASSPMTRDELEALSKRVEREIVSPQIATLARMLEEKDFNGADELFADWRKHKKRGPNGTWMLIAGYSNSTRVPNEEALLERMALMREWIDSNPASPTPRIMLAELWITYAWIGRGGGWASDLTETQTRLFSERLAKAHEILAEAKELNEQCPQLYTDMIKVGMGEGWAREEMEQTFRQGQTLAPDYQYLYGNMVIHLLPKWGGDPGEWEDFLDRSVPGGASGDEVYARVAQIISNDFDQGRELFTKSALSWERIRRGYRRIMSMYPAKKLNSNYFALMACAAGDRKTAHEIFGTIGEEFAQSVWHDRSTFDRARDWAEETPGSVVAQ